MRVGSASPDPRPTWAQVPAHHLGLAPFSLAPAGPQPSSRAGAVAAACWPGAGWARSPSECSPRSRARSNRFRLLFSHGAVRGAARRRVPGAGSGSVLTANQCRVGHGGARLLGYGGPRRWPGLVPAAGGDERRAAAAGGWKRGERGESWRRPGRRGQWKSGGGEGKRRET